LLHVLFERAFVDVASAKDHSALAFHAIFKPIAFVNVTIVEDLLSITILAVVSYLSFVNVTLRVIEHLFL